MAPLLLLELLPLLALALNGFACEEGCALLVVLAGEGLMAAAGEVGALLAVLAGSCALAEGDSDAGDVNLEGSVGLDAAVAVADVGNAGVSGADGSASRRPSRAVRYWEV